MGLDDVPMPTGDEALLDPELCPFVRFCLIACFARHDGKPENVSLCYETSEERVQTWC
jgi:hypothetical protein